MRNTVFGLAMCVWGCGTTGDRSAGGRGVVEAEAPAAETVPGPEPTDRAPPPLPASPEVPAPPDERPAVSAVIGLDLRALPTNAGPQGADMFVLGQGSQVRRLTPAGVDVEIRHVPGTGVLIPVFRAATADEAAATCAAVIDEYLEHAPRLPVIMQSAAILVEPCHTWEPPALP